jgi:tetratricopeptide (TPR) repeat protein
MGSEATAPQVPGSGAAALALAAGLALGIACASTPEPDPRYRPTESVLEVIAVLRVHVPDDTYRFEAARDYTGRNVYRSSLLRLESLESLHAEALRAGYMDGVIAFAKGRSLERLRAFDLAADQYRIAARRDPNLKVEALRSADVCDSLFEAAGTAVDLDDLSGVTDERPPLATDPEAALAQFEERVRLLEEVRDAAGESHYAAVVREEIERSDVARARYFVALRKVLPEGEVRAIGELQRVAARHSESKHANRHLIALADLYADLAVEYVEAHPPESLRFDTARFRELTDSASRLYEMVANQDGTPEKLEAARRLEAFLAFALRVDSDRFTP